MTNKKLLLVDYQLDNIQNIHQIKTDDTDINIVIDLNNIEINDEYEKIGLLVQNATSISNQKIELINDNNFSEYLNIDFNYETDSFNFNYSDSYLLTLKNFTIYGGVFYLSNNTMNCFIDNENGTININNNNVGEYSFYVNYDIFSLNIKKKITVNILPIIDYDDEYTIYDNTMFISPIPNITPNNLNGVFSIISNELSININSYNGSFILQGSNIGNYKFTINYNVNNILFTKTIKINVKPIITYKNNVYEIKYNETFTTDKPIIADNKYSSGVFTLNNNTDGFKINKETGEIIINEDKHLKTNCYNIVVNYLNFQVKLKVIVIPNVIYSYENFIENKTIIIKKPIVNSNSKVNFSVSLKNVSINKNTGMITLTNFEAGTYEIIVSVKYNGNVSNISLPITILPYINFNDKINITYGDNNKFEFDYFKSFGQITIKNNNNDITDKIINTITLETGKYNLNVFYTKGDQQINKMLEITVIPKIIHNIKDKYYIDENIQIETLENSNDGIFIYEGNEILMDKKSGFITINKPQAKNYNIDYVYVLNELKYNKNIKFTVIPTVKYESNITFYYGSNNIINKPFVNPLGGIFSIDTQTNKNIKIEVDGSISVGKNIQVGSYSINVNYTIDELVTQTQINLTILPNIIYEKDFFFDKNFISTIKPSSMLHNNVLFKIKNNYNNMFTINDYGEIFILNDINIGLYVLEIECIVSNVTVTNVINVNVSPNIIYNEQNYNVNYGSYFTINEPSIIDKGGKFYIINNNEEIEINSVTGKIKISNNILPGIYNFIVKYDLNNSVKNINFNLNVYPTLKYNEINIQYNKKIKSEEPNYSPKGGIFTCIYNKNVIIDNESGVLIFSNDIEVGSYTILVKYVYNNIFAEFECKYNVLPFICYNEKFNFTNKNFKIKPLQINPIGGTFKIDNKNFIINDSGEIKLDNVNIIGTTHLTIEYENILKTSKTIKINIEPEFNYNDTTINYKDNLKISPNISIDKGVFKLLNYNDIFNIDDYGIVTNKIIPNVGKYIINISYTVDEIILSKSLNLTILPIFKIDGNFYVEPENGKFEIKEQKNNISIDKKYGSVIFDNKTLLGTHEIEVTYTYNNISVTRKNVVNKKLTLEYEKQTTIIRGFETTFNPTVNFSGGNYKITKNNKNKNIKIDENTGIVTIDKDIALGNYNLEIEYSINDFVANYTIDFIVLSPFNYNSSVYDFNYGEIVKIEPSVNTSSSEFYILPETQGIVIDKTDGVITVNKLNVGSYSFNINCFSCGQLLNTTIKINIKPFIKYSESLINIKYGNSYLSKVPITYPDNGVFYTESNIINLNEDGSFYVLENIDVNIYYFDVIYEINEIRSACTIKVIVNPIFEYKHSEISFDVCNEYFTDMPIYYPKDGTFTIVNQPKGITVQKNGILHIDKNTPIGSYDLSVLYKVNKINLTNTLCIKVLPLFYYATIDLLKYNKYFIGFYKNKNINFEDFNEIFQCDKIINTNKPIFSNKGYFTIQNPPCAVNINGDDGVMTLKNNNIGIYSFDVNYNILNINKKYNYQALITPLFKYSTTKFTKKFKETLTTDNPIVYPEGGVFYFSETYDFFTVNYETGQVTCNVNSEINTYNILVFYEINGYVSYSELLFDVIPDTFINDIETTNLGKHTVKINNYYDNMLIKNYEIINDSIEIFTSDVGLYKMNLNGVYKNIEFPINFTIKVLPKIIYEKEIYYVDVGKTFVINKPYISHENGCFEIINKIKGITIDKISGEIYVFDKLQVKNYTVSISYLLNDVICETTISIVVKPILEYSTTMHQFYYGKQITIESPKYFPHNGTFTVNDIIINDGILSLNSLNVGMHDFNVVYTVNSVSVSVIINILIKPIINYEDKYIIEYGTGTCIYPVLLNPPDHSVKILNLPPHITLDEQTGIINITENCTPDIYPLELKYTVNDIESTTNINIIVDPFIEKTKTIKVIHGKYETINLHDTVSNITYKIDKNKFYIKDNKLQYNNLDVETYSFKISYKINKLSEEFNYTVNVYPNLIYDKNYEYSFGEKISILPTMYSPTNGNFKIINDFFTIDRHGCITQKQNTTLTIDTYIINVEYTVNKIKTTYCLQISIKPLLTYEKNIYEGYQNDLLIINPLNYLPKKLSFNVEPVGEINSNGQITINNLNIGKYCLKVNYDITSISLDVIIKPMFFYDDNNTIVDFGTNKVFIPSISQNGGKFYLKQKVNGIIIDENNGFVRAVNLLPDVYNIVVYYVYNDVEVNTELKITVKPQLKYNNNNLLIKYKTETSTIVPTFNPSGGKFYTETNIISNNIYLDESNGEISIDDANIGNYNIIINYSYNKQVVSQIVSFNVIPVILYDSCSFTFYGGVENKIEKPYVNPVNGKFSLNCDTYLSKNIIVSGNGAITINSDINVGNYDFSVLYEHSGVQYSTKISLNICPYIYYDNIVTEYQNNSLVAEPIFTISNHGIYDFSIVGYDLIISSDGKITNFNCLNVGTYKIYINYKHQDKLYQTYFLCQIVPILIPNFKDKTIYLCPNNGTIEYDNKYFELKENNIIYKNIYDNTTIPITYTVNNVSKKILVQYLSKPIKVFDSEINVRFGVDKIINSYVNFGIISSDDKPRNLKIDDLSLNIENLDVGSYSFTINYLVNNLTFNQNIKLIIFPEFYYSKKYFEINASIGNINEIPIMKPENGKISVKQFIKNININGNGVISSFNAVPGIYDFVVQYTVNNITSYDNISICCKPVITLQSESYTIKYGDPFVINYKCYPNLGQFTSSIPIISYNKSEITFNYLQHLNIGIHKVTLNYTFNNIKTTTDITLCIEPTILYVNKSYKTTYGKNIIIGAPQLSHNNGIFNIDVKTENKINSDDIIILNDGSINIGKLEIGNYTLTVSYSIEKIIVSDIVTLTVDPYLYYDENIFTIIFNKEHPKYHINAPNFYPHGGTFYIDTNSQNVTINKINGIIELDNLNIGKYNFNVFYKFKKNILKSSLTINMNPYVTYNLSVVNIKHKTLYTIDHPETSNTGGTFSSKKLPKGVSLNSKTGEIILNQCDYIDIGFYNIIVNYNINNLTTTTNIYINVTS